jgi:hypothetical protein
MKSDDVAEVKATVVSEAMIFYLNVGRAEEPSVYILVLLTHHAERDKECARTGHRAKGGDELVVTLTPVIGRDVKEFARPPSPTREQLFEFEERYVAPAP